jgi:hypothetical protein
MPVLLGDTPDNENVSVTDILPLPFTRSVFDVHVLHSGSNTIPQIIFHIALDSKIRFHFRKTLAKLKKFV